MTRYHNTKPGLADEQTTPPEQCQKHVAAFEYRVGCSLPRDHEGVCNSDGPVWAVEPYERR